MNNLYRFIVAGMLLLAVSPLWSPLRAQVFLPYDATGVTDKQKTSNPSRLAYPTRLQEQIKKEVKQTCGNMGAVFSVSETKKVVFAPGNLQYQASTNTWRFAEHQWDYVGDAFYGTVYQDGEKCNNEKISNTYTGWIDLFGWGTGNNPTLSSGDNSDYSTFIDWGINPISNGGNTPDMWRTLTFEEWKYLFATRSNAESRFGAAKVNEIAGVVVLPDEWTLPAGCDFTAGMTSAGADWSMVKNVYTASQWQAMETNGAVFLPASGYREVLTILFAGKYGGYWSSTKLYYSSSTYIYQGFSALSLYTNSASIFGLSVRLVQDVNLEPSEINLTISIKGDGGMVVANNKDTLRTGYTLSYKNNNPFTTTIKAIPNEGYTFSKWSDGNTDNPRTIQVTQNMTLSAIFTKTGGSGGKGIGVFSVSDTKKVTFAPGNLQYQASTDTWRFAENQWDYVGDATNGTVYQDGEKCNNENISNTYNGWIDLFGWGSGHNPTNKSSDTNDYLTFTDWGVNPISNGGNTPEQWRTLTKEEWVYLFHGRNKAGQLFGLGSVNGVNGIIILSDDWTTPSGGTFTPSTSKGLTWNKTSEEYYNNYANNFSHNTYTIEQWQLMQSVGAVFLPVTGERRGTKIIIDGTHGYYWASTINYNLYFNLVYLAPSDNPYLKTEGDAVRLVSDL